jgi:hypothetical protein
VGQSSTNAPQAKDFVATIDVTEGSPCFGQIISEADVPTSGNEPHHVGLNQDGTVSIHHQSMAVTSYACTVCRFRPAASQKLPLHAPVAHTASAYALLLVESLGHGPELPALGQGAC